MSDPKIKQRLRRSRSRIRTILKRSKYRVVTLQHDPVFDIEASRQSEVRKIRVVLDEISPGDLMAVRNVPLPPPPECSKEIWLQRNGETGFEVEEIL